jgi:tRNA-intron endonuclease
MEAIVEGKLAWLHSTSLEKRGFGVKKGNRLFLHPVETVYLALKGDIVVMWRDKKAEISELFKWAVACDPEFPSFYFTYEDLRERGYKVRPFDRFLVNRDVFLPISERKEITIPWLFDVKKDFESLILGIVDEESDLTYYRVTDVEMKGKQKERVGWLSGHIVRDRVLTENTEIFREYFYGYEKGGIVSLSLIESLYLVERGAMEIYADKKLSVEEIKRIGESIESNFMRRYEVYRDLKERGFVVKTGFKFGSDFRVYDEMKSVADLPHSKYLVAVVDDKKMPIYEVARAVRLAHNVKKVMIFAFKANEENRYLMIERVKV